MLKVVGASWQKTRIGTYILIGAGLLVIGAFFISYMERPQYSGTYCATAFWSKHANFQIEYWKQQNDLQKIPQGAARICYKDSIHENGWAQMEVETQRPYPDWVQAYGAGILEGSLTWNNIYNQWVNTIQSSCEKDESSEKFCTWLREVLEKNYNKTKELAEVHGDHDHYWHQIRLFIYQVRGLEAGYFRGAKRARSDLEEEIPFIDFLLMNAAADIQDLKIYYENYVLTGAHKSNETEPENADLSPKNFFLPSATMLTKIIQNKDDENRQLLFGHSTAGSYSSMLRIQKRYKFHYHMSQNPKSNTVPGADITFTSYPGILGSTDDFYIIKGRQVHSIVAGVGMKNENLKLWKDVDIEQFVPLVGRAMAANRISQNRKTWAKAMSRHPYTGAKQWITVDINKLGSEPQKEENLEDESHLSVNAFDEAVFQDRHNRNKGLIWIIEQLPGRMHSKDVSESFLNPGNSTWIANGVPYFDEILEASGVSKDNFSSDLSPAVNDELFSLEAVDKYLRSHGFRGDLLGEESVAYGNIDLKLYSYNGRLRISDYHAIAGPIFMRLQHVQPRAATSKEVNSETVPQQETESDSPFKPEPQPKLIDSAIGDERLSVSLEDAGDMAELEIITERRSVRNDMKAIALRKIGTGPFKWSDISEKISHAGHEGHPNEWNFEKVSPKWAW